MVKTGGGEIIENAFGGSEAEELASFGGGEAERAFGGAEVEAGISG